MKVAQISKPNGPFEIVEREIPTPGPGWVRIKVQACGICHSDSFTVLGDFIPVQYPKVPGHEIAGVIDALGAGVTGLTIGQRVGIGWNGGYCGQCTSCRKGDFITCENIQVPGINYDGGYSEYMVAPVNALAMVPQSISPVDVGPLMCAGITTFNSLRNSGARAGDVVAVLGIGGLGHLAVQFAAKMGFHTVAIARGKDKESLAKKLGAHQYIDSQSEDPAKKLQQIGGAKVILSTVTDSPTISANIAGLGVNGKIIVLGISNNPIQVYPGDIIGKRLSILGWPSGTSLDSQETMDFCAMTGIRSMNQTFPLERVSEAYEVMMSGKARFRVVLTMDNHH